MSIELRAIADVRRGLPDIVTNALAPLERCAQQLALQSSEFSTLLLQSHSAASLPPSAGAEAIVMASEAAALAAEARARIATAHSRLVDVFQEFWRVGAPACPPNEPG